MPVSHRPETQGQMSYGVQSQSRDSIHFSIWPLAILAQDNKNYSFVLLRTPVNPEFNNQPILKWDGFFSLNGEIGEINYYCIVC